MTPGVLLSRELVGVVGEDRVYAKVEQEVAHLVRDGSEPGVDRRSRREGIWRDGQARGMGHLDDVRPAVE